MAGLSSRGQPVYGHHSVADIDTSMLQAMVRTAVEMNRIKGDPTQRG